MKADESRGVFLFLIYIFTPWGARGGGGRVAQRGLPVPEVPSDAHRLGWDWGLSQAEQRVAWDSPSMII